MQWIIDIVKFKLASYLQGKIFLWSGAIVDIPTGWALCDGTQGTPNFRDYFVAGAGLSYSPNDSGGDLWHDHDFTANGIFHQIVSGTAILNGTGYHWKTSTHALPGTTGFGSARPEWYALAFIMKL